MPVLATSVRDSCHTFKAGVMGGIWTWHYGRSACTPTRANRHLFLVVWLRPRGQREVLARVDHCHVAFLVSHGQQSPFVRLQTVDLC